MWLFCYICLNTCNMILNFNCDRVQTLNNGTTQNVMFTKTNKKVGKKDTITLVVGKLSIDGDGISILITDENKFDVYTEGQSYNIEVFAKPALEEQKKALAKPEVKKN